MKKRILCAILAAMLLTPTFTACSNSDAGTNTDAQTPEQTTDAAADATAEVVEEELSDYEQRQLIPDDLPEMKFDDRTFTVMASSTTQADYYAEIKSDELNGDACNDSIYNRNIKVEDRFGTKIECILHETPYTQLKTMATSGVADAQIVGHFDYMSYNPINAQACLNWIEVPYVNLEKPWHNDLANDDATVMNQLYTICSDLSITSMTFTHALFTNVDLLDTYGYTPDDMYGVIKEGKWTIDYFNDLVSGMYIDENGNGKADLKDQYGFGYQITNPGDVWFTAFGEHMTGRDEDGHIITTFMSDKTISMLEKLMTLHYNNQGYVKLSTQYDEEKWFLDQMLVFAPMRFQAAFNVLRDMDATYTMLPFPKWDETQETYYTNADDKFTVFTLPTTSYGDLEFIGIIYEALCAESYKQVFPAYYDQALKGKYSSDPTTAEMVELIMAGRMFDFAFQFGESAFQRIPYMIRDCLLNNTPDLASKYKKIEKALTKGMDKTFSKVYYGE